MKITSEPFTNTIFAFVVCVTNLQRIEELGNQIPALKVYPNPAFDQITIQKLKEGKPSMIKVTN